MSLPILLNLIYLKSPWPQCLLPELFLISQLEAPVCSLRTDMVV